MHIHSLGGSNVRAVINKCTSAIFMRFGIQTHRFDSQFM